MAHKRRSYTVLLIGVGLILLLALIWVLQSVYTKKAADEQSFVATTQQLEVKPHPIETSDAYTRYIDAALSRTISPVLERNLYTEDEIDWNTEMVVAVPFILLESRTYLGIGIEEVEGKHAYVIDSIDVADCGSYAQVHTNRVAFIAQPSSQPYDLPVILRVTPNTASCDGLSQ